MLIFVAFRARIKSEENLFTLVGVVADWQTQKRENNLLAFCSTKSWKFLYLSLESDERKVFFHENVCKTPNYCETTQWSFLLFPESSAFSHAECFNCLLQCRRQASFSAPIDNHLHKKTIKEEAKHFCKKYCLRRKLSCQSRYWWETRICVKGIWKANITFSVEYFLINSRLWWQKLSWWTYDMKFYEKNCVASCHEVQGYSHHAGGTCYLKLFVKSFREASSDL